MPELRTPEKAINELLTNIAKGISSIGVSRLNAALCSILIRTEDKNNSIDVVIDAVCDDFEITPPMIKENYELAIKARRILCCILHFELGLSTRAISKAVIGKETNSHTAVYQIIKRYRNLNESVKADREFKQRYDRIYNRVKDKIEP